jgi:YgiT-type zinc finger domain-containing protein
VTSITFTRDETAIVIRQVPADVCDNCGHAYFDSTVVDVLEQIHEATLGAGAKYAIRDFSSKVA